jgi:hypothetical protein
VARALLVALVAGTAGGTLWPAGPGPRSSPTARLDVVGVPSSAPPIDVSTLAGAVRAGRFVRTVWIGGLEVRPDPAAGTAPLGLDLAAASRLASLTTGLRTPTILGFGRVTLRGVATPAGAPRLVDAPGWVAVASLAGDVYNCPVRAVPQAPALPGEHGIYEAAIFFGSVAGGGSGALLYNSTGLQPCGGLTGPSLATASAAVPVAWSVTGPVGLTTTVRYQAPVCSHVSSVSAGGNVNTGIYTATVTVSVPFDRTGCGAVSTFTTTVSVYPASAGPTAPAPPSRVILGPAPIPSVPPALVGPLAAGASS